MASAATLPSTRLQSSSHANPCPVCGRTKDGDCRISSDALMVLCRRGSTFAPPDDLKPGDVIEGKDGLRWAYTGESSDGRNAVFTPDKPRPPRGRVVAFRSQTNSKATPAATAVPIGDPIVLARLPHPTEEPPAHLPDGYTIEYSPTQWVKVTRDASGDKKHKPWCRTANGRAINRNGPDPWPLFNQADALEHGPGQWIAEAEGEKCAMWLGAGGLVAVSHPGPDHTPVSIERRYQRLLDAGVAGVVYLADNDPPGESKAQKCADAAAAVGLPLLVLRAAEVWPGLPTGGSIDDAPGTAAERVAALQAAIPAAVERHQQEEEPRDPSRREVELRTYSELLTEMLLATIDGDDDTLMELRAETISRFRRTDAQIEAALFELHARHELGSRTTTEPESLDLSRLCGMDWLIEGFVPDNDLALLWGNAGAGKTTAALAMAQAVVQGTGLLDHEHQAPIGNVLFIASDSGASPLYAAMQASGMADIPEVHNGPQKRFHVWAADKSQGATAWAADLRGCVRLLQFIRKHQIRLVLIDSCKAVCSRAGLDYANNQLVTALLTYFKEVICPHAAVVWLNHDGTAKHAHAGAKAWKEIPSIVHRIIREENKDGSFVESRRQWSVTKNRMGTGREFYYEFDQGDLRLSPDQERTGNCLARVVDVLLSAWQQQGVEALSLTELTTRICGHGGPSLKTLKNTLATATRAKHPEVVRAGRGIYRLAPRMLDSLKGVHSFRDFLSEKPVSDWDLSKSRQSPDGTFGTFSQPEPPAPAESPIEVPRDFDGTLLNTRDTNGSERKSPETHAPPKGGTPPEPPSGQIRSTTDWVETACSALKLAPHPMHLSAVMAWLRTRDAGLTQRQAVDALDRLHADDCDDDQPVFDLA